jgi:hypothetical protein
MSAHMIVDMAFLASLEQTAFSVWVRESGSLWAYPGILFMHTVGMGFLVGANTAIDLRILGVAPRLSLAPMEKLFPFMWLGFWINAVSGTILLAADATTKIANPAFAVKMGCIALSVVNVMLTKRYVFHDQALEANQVSMRGKTLAVTSLTLWTIAITAGRLMAYVGQDSGASEFINHIGGK